MNRKWKFLIGGGVIVAALGYMMYAGVSQSVVYFVTKRVGIRRLEAERVA